MCAILFVKAFPAFGALVPATVSAGAGKPALTLGRIGQCDANIRLQRVHAGK